MKLTTLVENKQAVKQLKCEHGLSFHIQTDRHTILFDTGQSDKLLHNTQLLGIKLEEVDYVILSHGHYDHTGGLPHFLSVNTKAKVIVHPNAFKQRFSQSPQMVKENGIAWRDDMSQFSNRFLFTDEDTELLNDIWILTNIKPQKGFEVLNHKLVTKTGNQYVPDTFDDELILVLKENETYSVICGCAHTGIVNILHQIKERFNQSSFRLIAGGLHLKGKKASEIEHVIKGLKPFNVSQWALNHCTGEPAFKHFYDTFPEQVVYCSSGMVIEI